MKAAQLLKQVGITKPDLNQSQSVSRALGIARKSGAVGMRDNAEQLLRSRGMVEAADLVAKILPQLDVVVVNYPEADLIVSHLGPEKVQSLPAEFRDRLLDRTEFSVMDIAHERV